MTWALEFEAEGAAAAAAAAAAGAGAALVDPLLPAFDRLPPPPRKSLPSRDDLRVVCPAPAPASALPVLEVALGAAALAAVVPAAAVK